jgi:hypothetical protein
MLPGMLLASSLGDSLALIAVFFVLFPVVVQGLIMFAAAQAIGEKRANEEYRQQRRQGAMRS